MKKIAGKEGQDGKIDLISVKKFKHQPWANVQFVVPMVVHRLAYVSTLAQHCSNVSRLLEKLHVLVDSDVDSKITTPILKSRPIPANTTHCCFNVVPTSKTASQH